MPIGIQQNASRPARNSAKDDGLFAVISSNPRFVRVVSTNGRISVQSTRAFQSIASCDATHQCQATVIISVSGGPTVRIAVHSDGVLPEMELEKHQ
jgi:hypothetical protein